MNWTKVQYVQTLHILPRMEKFTMEDEQLLEVVKTKYFRHDQTKYFALKKPNLSTLTGEELQYIDLVLNKHVNKTAAQISELSHRDVPWISAQNGELLDYDAVFYRNAETSVRSYAV